MGGHHVKDFGSIVLAMDMHTMYNYNNKIIKNENDVLLSIQV